MMPRLFSAMLFATALGGCAHAYEPGYGPDILAELPASAPPGECYARVQVPGQAPPVLQGAQWVQMSGPPGSPGPIWCLVPTGAQQVAWDAPRYGFIRVLCDDDMTPARVHGIQQSLYDRGYYRGAVSGRYDAATAQAVARFQSSASISHGGYLSYDTLQALEGGVGYQGYAGPAYAPPPMYAPPAFGQQVYGQQAYAGGYASSYAYGQGYGGGYGGPVNPCLNPCMGAALPPPPPPPPPMPLPQPCCAVVQPCQVNVCGGYGGGYGYGGAAYHSSAGYGFGQGFYTAAPAPAYASASASASAYARGGYGGAYASARASSSVQGGWLTWGGKSGF